MPAEKSVYRETERMGGGKKSNPKNNTRRKRRIPLKECESKTRAEIDTKRAQSWPASWGGGTAMVVSCKRGSETR